MKKYLLLILCLVPSFVALAQSGTCGTNLTWKLENGVLTISGKGEMTDYVGSSNAPWYGFKRSINRIVINEGVTSIGEWAFSYCSGLTSVTIGNSVTSIGKSTFFGCSGLTSVTIGNSVTSIGYSAFSYCSGLTSVTIPNSVTSIGNHAFYGCSRLVSLTIPSSVTYVGGDAVGSDTDVNYPKDICFMPKKAPNGWKCNNWKGTAHVHNSSLESYKSAGVSWGSKIVGDIGVSLDKSNVTLIKGETWQMKISAIPKEMPLVCTSSNTSVATVSNTGLITAKGLGTTTITIANTDDKSIRTICTITVKAGSISLNKTSETLAKGETLQLTATKSPSNMSVKWTSSNTSVATVSNTGLVTAKGVGTATITVANAADSSEKATCTITVKNGTISLSKTNASLTKGETLQLTATKTPSDMSVAWTSSNTSVATVSNTGLVTGVGGGTAIIKVANSNDPTVSATCEVEVFDMVIESDGDAILKAGDSKQLRVKGYNGSIKWSSSHPSVASISDNGMVKAIAPGSTIITAEVVGDSKNSATFLVDVVAAGVIYIGKIYYKLEGNDAIVTNAVGGKPMVEYPRNDYKGTISIPSSITYSGQTYEVTSVGEYAFYNMAELQALQIPASIRHIKMYACAESGTLARVIFSTPAQSELEIIDDSAFSKCQKLDGVALPDNVHTIGNSAFRYCSALTNFTMPKKLNMINEYAFANCTSLNNIILPDAVGAIQNYAFAYDSSLESMTFPENIQGIGAYCFTDCTKLTDVKFLTQSGEMTIGSNAFKGCNSLNRVDVKKLDAWVKIAFENEMANPLALGHNLYRSDKLDTDPVIPIGVNFINNFAFYGCTSIRSINIPSSVEFINDNIFYGCTNLKTVKCFATMPPAFLGQRDPAEMNNVFKQATLYVPEASVVQYKNDSWWKRFVSILGINESYPDTPEVGSVTINTSSEGYATFYSSESAYALPAGFSAYVVTACENNKLTFKKITGDAIPKGTAVMLESSSKHASSVTLSPSTSTTTYSGTNYLHGSDAPTTTSASGSNYYYKLTYGDGADSNNFGWYWGAADGSAFQIGGHQAWLAVPKSSAKRSAFLIKEHTDIENTAISGSDATYYNLQGLRVNAANKAGIYIVNGKKFINKK